MFSVTGTVAVPVVVRPAVQLTGVEFAVVSLLQLDGVGTTVLSLLKKFLATFQATLMIVPDFRDDIAVAVVRNHLAGDTQLGWHGLILLSSAASAATLARSVSFI
jgi:hypothetical protein